MNLPISTYNLFIIPTQRNAFLTFLYCGMQQHLVTLSYFTFYKNTSNVIQTDAFYWYRYTTFKPMATKCNML